MDEPGQRFTQPQIIDDDEVKTPARLIVEGILTVLLWGVWGYFVLPFITLILWYFGVQFLITETFVKGGYAEFVYMLKGGGVIIFAVMMVILGWVYYNYRWFMKRGERRNRFVKISIDGDLAEYFHLDPERVRQFKQGSRAVVSFTDGQIALEEVSGSPTACNNIRLVRMQCTACEAELKVAAHKVPARGVWGKCPKCSRRIFVTDDRKDNPKEEIAAPVKKLEVARPEIHNVS